MNKKHSDLRIYVSRPRKGGIEAGAHSGA